MSRTIKMIIGGAVALTAGANVALASDVTAGAAVFKKCKVCHSAVEGQKKVGPSLYGVVGRTPGTLAGFNYSPAMTGFGAGGAVWDAATLAEYLIAPRTLVPKTKMIFPGLSDEADRLNVVAYLDSLDD